MRWRSLALAAAMCGCMLSVPRLRAADEPTRPKEEFPREALKLREAAITSVEPRISAPTTKAHPGPDPWKRDIVTTIFHVGGRTGQKQSAWRAQWAQDFGGCDDPDPKARTADFRPSAFVPKLNPFYVALPYNDLVRGTTKPEARRIIPWFTRNFVREGESVCCDRWLAIRDARNGRIAYAQWCDVGPGSSTHWQYVFGNERPKPTKGGDVGLEISPAVRDFLGVSDQSVNAWRFVEFQDIPLGPWRTYGENNPFVRQAQSALETPRSDAPSKDELQNVEPSSP